MPARHLFNPRAARLSQALGEILGDMDSSGLRMFRLLQGDVGSGKTAVAFLAMLKAAGQGSQSCMLAPTEVLTVQHLQVSTLLSFNRVVIRHVIRHFMRHLLFSSLLSDLGD